MITIDDVTFRIEQDLIDVTSIREPDPDWKFIDKKGHVHVWYLVNGELAVVASVKYVEDAPSSDEFPAIGHTECRRCDQVVEPGWRVPPHRVVTTGLRSYFINDEEVSEEGYMKLWNEVMRGCE